MSRWSNLGNDWSRWFRSKQGVYTLLTTGGMPVVAYFTREYWAGKPTIEPKQLPARYEYAQDIQNKNRAALQDLLDKAKEGKMGGHWANDNWTDTNPESAKHGPWDVPVRAARNPKKQED